MPTSARLAEIHRDYQVARAQFHRVLDSLAAEQAGARSLNPGWTNGQVMFHITLGFMIMPALVRIIWLFGHLPGWVSKAFAWLLDASTPFFNWINGLAPRGAVKVFHGQRLARRFDGAIAAALKTADRIKPSDWGLSMHYPRRWDPMFKEDMTISHLYNYMLQHMQFHLGQLSVPLPAHA
jgi:hypothetical protein